MRTDDELRGFYADQPIDPAAEQRLRTVIADAGPEQGAAASATRRWLAVAATAAVVVTGSVSVYQLRAPHPTVPTVPTGQATTAPAEDATVPLTPRIAAGILIDLAHAGGSVGDVRGGTGDGLVTASLRYAGSGGSGVLAVTVCRPTAAGRCLLPSVSGVFPTRRADGSQLVLFRPGLRNRLGYLTYAWQVHVARPDGIVVSVIDVPDGGPRSTLEPTGGHDVVVIATSGRWQLRVPRAVGEAEARAVPGSGSGPLPEASPPQFLNDTPFPFAPAAPGLPLPNASARAPGHSGPSGPSVTPAATPSETGSAPQVSTDPTRATR